MRVEHVAFLVDDPNVVSKWYCENLGMRQVRQGPGPNFMTFHGIKVSGNSSKSNDSTDGNSGKGIFSDNWATSGTDKTDIWLSKLSRNSPP